MDYLAVATIYFAKFLVATNFQLWMYFDVFLLTFFKIPLDSLAHLLALRSVAGLFSALLAPLLERLAASSCLLLGVFLHLLTLSPAWLLFRQGALAVGWGGQWRWVVVCAGQVVSGICQAFVQASSQKVIAEEFSEHLQARITGAIETSWGMGTFVGMPLVGLAASKLGWSSAFGLLVVLHVPVLLVLGRLKSFGVRRSPSGKLRERSAAGRPGASWICVPLAWCPLLAFVFVNLAGTSFPTFFGLWMGNFGLSQQTTGYVDSLLGMALLLSEMVVSCFGDRAGIENAAILTLLPLGCAAGAIALIAGTNHVSLPIFLGFWFSFFFEAAYVLMMTVAPSVSSRNTGSYVSVFFALGTLGNALSLVLAPALWEHGLSFAALFLVLWIGIATVCMVIYKVNSGSALSRTSSQSSLMEGGRDDSRDAGEYGSLEAEPFDCRNSALYLVQHVVQSRKILPSMELRNLQTLLPQCSSSIMPQRAGYMTGLRLYNLIAILRSANICRPGGRGLEMKLQWKEENVRLFLYKKTPDWEFERVRVFMEEGASLRLPRERFGTNMEEVRVIP
eukprot:g72262.t1